MAPNGQGARILGRIHLPVDAAATEVAAEAVPLVAEAERSRVRPRWARERAHPRRGRRQDTLTALQKTGQVRALVMNDDFAQPGWADYTTRFSGLVRLPAEHPFGGGVCQPDAQPLSRRCVRRAPANEGTVTLIATVVPVGEDAKTAAGCR